MKWPPENAIVVPVDFSDLSKEALEAALVIAGNPARVRVIHVLPRIEPVEPIMIVEAVDDDLRSQHAKDMLRQWLDKVHHPDLQIDIAFGDPGHEIARYAEEVGADLVVMPSHGRAGIARVLIGSVAERTVRLAHCPVLVLRKP